MLAMKHIAFTAVLTVQGLTASESEPPLLEFFQEGFPGAPLLRREDASLPRHRNQREAIEAVEEPRRGQETILLENHGAETPVTEASLLHMQVGKHGSGMSHDCKINTDCVDELCGDEQEVQCVKGWCFAKRKFGSCVGKPNNYILDDGGLCTEGKREALCPAKGCRDMPIPKVARESSFSVATDEELKGFIKCEEILKWEGVTCQLKPIAVTFCRKTCDRCSSFAPWDSQPPDVFTRQDSPISAKTGVDGGPDIETVKEFEGEEERIEKKTGDEVTTNPQQGDEVKEGTTSWAIMIGICALLVTLIFGAVGVVISHSKVKRAEAKLAAIKEAQEPQERIEAPEDEADAAETAAAESPEIAQQETAK